MPAAKAASRKAVQWLTANPAGVGQFRSLFFWFRSTVFIDLGQELAEKPPLGTESEDLDLQNPFDPACLVGEPLCF